MNIKKKYITVFILLILSIGMVYFIFTKETTNSVDLDKCLKYKRIATEDVKKGVAKYYHTNKFKLITLNQQIQVTHRPSHTMSVK